MHWLTTWLLVVLAGCLSGFTACGYDNPTEDEAIQEIQELLPVGSSREDAEALLREHHIEFSFADRQQLDTMMLDRDRPPSGSDIKGRYLGVVRDVEANVSSTKSYSIEIDIDRDDRVADVRVIPIHTAP